MHISVITVCYALTSSWVASGHGPLSLQQLVVCVELCVKLLDDLLQINALLRIQLVPIACHGL